MRCVYDVKSSYQWIYFSKSKEAAVVIQILELVLADLVIYGKELKFVRSDAEEVFRRESNLNFLFHMNITRMVWRDLFSILFEEFQL